MSTSTIIISNYLRFWWHVTEQINHYVLVRSIFSLLSSSLLQTNTVFANSLDGESVKWCHRSALRSGCGTVLSEFSGFLLNFSGPEVSSFWLITSILTVLFNFNLKCTQVNILVDLVFSMLPVKNLFPFPLMQFVHSWKEYGRKYNFPSACIFSVFETHQTLWFFLSSIRIILA